MPFLLVLLWLLFPERGAHCRQNVLIITNNGAGFVGPLEFPERGAHCRHCVSVVVEI